jgi:two-component system, NtrC family, response regulator HydG
MEHGAMGVLTKPIEIGKLLRAVDEARPSGIVLIADEDPLFGVQLQQLINGAGFVCDLLRDEGDMVGDPSNFTIIDIGKPLINSVEVYTRLRRQGHVRPAIIVTKSADAGGDAFDALRDIAVTGVLNKPFDPMQLLQKLDTLAA